MSKPESTASAIVRTASDITTAFATGLSIGSSGFLLSPFVTLYCLFKGKITGTMACTWLAYSPYLVVVAPMVTVGSTIAIKIIIYTGEKVYSAYFDEEKNRYICQEATEEDLQDLENEFCSVSDEDVRLYKLFLQQKKEQELAEFEDLAEIVNDMATTLGAEDINPVARSSTP